MAAKYEELDADTLMTFNKDELIEEYGYLLEHHIAETKELYKRVPKRGPSVLVIGPDRVGKTTVCRHLAAELGIPVFKCPAEKQIFKQGGRSSLAFDYTMTHFMEQTGHRFVSDRAYPCEWVYSKVFGRETDTTLLEFIDARHEGMGTKILYLYSDPDPTEVDDLVPPEKYWDVKRMYDKFCEWTSCKVTAVNTAEMIEAFGSGWDTSRSFALRCMELMELKK